MHAGRPSGPGIHGLGAPSNGRPATLLCKSHGGVTDKDALVRGLAEALSMPTLLYACVLSRISSFALLPACRWVVPLVWTPIVLACIARAFLVPGVLAATTFLLVCLGVALWQLLEYSIHRQARNT